MKGIARLAIVTAVAGVAFVVALVSFHQVPARECQMSGVRDSSYDFRLEERPEVNVTTYHLLVTHNGRPVEGATVCMRADMGGLGRMSGMGVSNVGREVDPGRYEVDVRLEMSGHWDGRAIVEERGGRAVVKPLAIEVS